MTGDQSFYDILFNGQKIVAAKQCGHILPVEKWDCRMGVLSVVPQTAVEEKLVRDMMSACSLVPGDWRIFPEGTIFPDLVHLPGLRFLLLFDCPEKKLSLSIQLPYYRPVTFNDKIFIRAHNLEALVRNADYKKALWNQALKPLFE
ncbi:MAG TPA: hypothetical protein VFL76_07765 [Edaphocola sp.]|nr:hypothetical protein [Edaphocola sp.]